jgi:hypothetical protein
MQVKKRFAESWRKVGEKAAEEKAENLTVI